MFARSLTRAILKPRVFNPILSTRSLSGFSSLSPRSLDEILKRDLIANESREKIVTIWEEYHNQSNSSVGFTIKGMDMILIASRMAECSMCIWPVYKNETDHFMLLSQFQDKFVLCTYLEEYKTNPGGASPWMSLAMFDEFCSDKDLSLIRGDFTPNLTKAEGDTICRMIMHAYHNNESYEFIKKFNQKPSEFNFEEYLNHFSNINKDLKDDAIARKAKDAIEQIAPVE
jgi:hypothetical protein